MSSLWLDPNLSSPGYRSVPYEADPFVAGKHFDLIVVGAGLTGLTSALLFARAGMSVAVVEARHIGAVTTGNTTAKVSVLQGTRLSNILRHKSLRTGRAYVEANEEGRDWLLRYCEEHAVPVQRRDAYSYAGTPEGAVTVQREFRAARRLGLDVTLEHDDELPYETYGAVRLANQAQIHPMEALAALAADVKRHGGVIHEGVRVTKAKAGSPTMVTTGRGALFGDQVILATGMPVLDRGLYFGKLTPLRSYAQAFRVTGALPQGMYLSVDSPSRSLRTAAVNGEELLVVGGNGHPVGREKSPRGRVEDLHEWTRQHFPDAQRTHAWSAQDYEPLGRIPYVGRLPGGRGHIFVATGYDKWGMTNAVAAALTLSSTILGGHMPWATTLHRTLPSLADAGSFLGANAAVSAALTKGYVTALRTKKPGAVAEGQGVVAHQGPWPVGTSTVKGKTCTVSAVCPHLGGVLSWNDAEMSWDCPLHGSRFDAAGVRLEGPALSDLPRR
ncbi:MAG: dependent oxidoreductase [Homoserinimonas sp.]|jgi:glycine/D-amino acid oxidase-like deaminating enzyme/nitrite reductase/ring-hydroxylating ferredoxin subunit|nr:dependent oxidoreductase [Homoserinimonas sp.]